MPKIFNVIDKEMRQCFQGKRLEKYVSGVSSGVVEYGEKWVQSQPISFADKRSVCFIKGKLDTIIKFDNATYGIIDFKTTQRKAESLPIYSRQLHAYAYALEHPAANQFSLSPISRLGLLVYEPQRFTVGNINQALLKGELAWIEISRNDNKFLDFLKQVVCLLEKPTPPPASPSCEWCQYRHKSRDSGL